MAESIKKFIIKDAHGGTKESGSFSVVGEVHVDIVPGYGEHYADSEYVGGVLTITIHNIDGNGITEITTDSQEGDEAVNTVTIKTNANPEGFVLDVRNGSRGNGIASSSEVLSSEDGGTNTHTFTDDDGNNHVFHTKNGQTGRKGDKGDSAIFTGEGEPWSGLKNTTGQSTTEPMTQKAVTDAIKESSYMGVFSELDLTGESRLRYYIDTNTGQWVSVATTTQSSCFLIEIPKSWYALKILPKVRVDGYVTPYDVEFLVTNTSPCTFAEGGMRGYKEGEESPDGVVIIPDDANYLYIRYNSSGSSRMPAYIGHSVSAKEAASQIESEISTERGRIDVLENEIPKLKHFFLGTLVQYGLTASGLSESTERVSMLSCVALPYPAVTLKFKLPKGWSMGFRSGAYPDNLNNNDYWYNDGDTFTFPSNALFCRGCFAKRTGTNASSTYYTITVEETLEKITNGEISITYEDDGIGIIECNYDNEKRVRGAMRNYVDGANNNTSLRNSTLPTFAHTSDVHGDVMRFKRFVKYCDYLGVDAALATGDLVARASNNRMNYINDVADMHNTPVMICMGNHDARSLTAQQQNEYVMAYLIEKNGSEVNDLVEFPTYYYHDFTDRNIRLISLNLYEEPHSGDNENFTATQCEWFIDTLANTPEDYGVLVLFHAPETLPQPVDGKDDFYQKDKNYSGVQTNISGHPFAHIIDAFIGRASTSITYSVGSTSITVSADFEHVASGVEFVAWVNGHMHTDSIGYLQDTTYMQLNLNVCCCSGVFSGASYPNFANLQDTPRGWQGATQDAFNVYSIDRANKTVKITRVGSNTTYHLDERKAMVIPYAEQEG